MFSKKDIERFWSKVAIAREDDCWVWTANRNSGGYGHFRMPTRTLGAHRVAYALSNGESLPDLDVLHTCDNPPCCNPAHLWLGTDIENSIDKVNKGRSPKGERHGLHKLTDAQVAEIRERYAKGGCSYKSLAPEYGVTYQHIGAVIRKLRRP